MSSSLRISAAPDHFLFFQRQACRCWSSMLEASLFHSQITAKYGLTPNHVGFVLHLLPLAYADEEDRRPHMLLNRLELSFALSVSHALAADDVHPKASTSFPLNLKTGERKTSIPDRTKLKTGKAPPFPKGRGVVKRSLVHLTKLIQHNHFSGNYGPHLHNPADRITGMHAVCGYSGAPNGNAQRVTSCTNPASPAAAERFHGADRFADNRLTARTAPPGIQPTSTFLPPGLHRRQPTNRSGEQTGDPSGMHPPSLSGRRGKPAAPLNSQPGTVNQQLNTGDPTRVKPTDELPEMKHIHSMGPTIARCPPFEGAAPMDRAIRMRMHRHTDPTVHPNRVHSLSQTLKANPMVAVPSSNDHHHGHHQRADLHYLTPGNIPSEERQPARKSATSPPLGDTAFPIGDRHGTARAGTNANQLSQVDVNNLAIRVYDRIVDRLKRQRELRGR